MIFRKTENTKVIPFTLLALLMTPIIVIAIPTVLVIIFFYNQLSFSPEDFINEMFRFALGLVSLLISFNLGTVYWSKQQKNEQQAIFVFTLLLQIEECKKQVQAILKLSNTIISAGSESLTRDKRISESLVRLDILLKILARHIVSFNTTYLEKRFIEKLSSLEIEIEGVSLMCEKFQNRFSSEDQTTLTNFDKLLYEVKTYCLGEV